MPLFGYSLAAAPKEPAPKWSTEYAIRDRETGEVMTRTMEWWWDVKRQTSYQQLVQADQAFADALAGLAQQVCSYFYAPDAVYVPMEGCPEIEISDEEIRERIARVMAGEFKREAEDRRKRQYPMDELPWDQQRAYLEQIERLKNEWGFRRLGRITLQAPAA